MSGIDPKKKNKRQLAIDASIKTLRRKMATWNMTVTERLVFLFYGKLPERIRAAGGKEGHPLFFSGFPFKKIEKIESCRLQSLVVMLYLMMNAVIVARIIEPDEHSEL